MLKWVSLHIFLVTCNHICAFKCFTDFGVCLIYTHSDISEHSSRPRCSPLALCGRQSFNSLDIIGAVQ